MLALEFYGVYRIMSVCVPGLREDIPGNCVADEIARADELLMNNNSLNIYS